MWRLRAFQHGDDEALVALWNATLTRDPISPALFRRQTLLHPDFDPAGCFLAEAADSRLLGFAIAIAPHSDGLFSEPHGVGRIAGIGVHPDGRAQGIGTALLDAALAWLAGRGCARVVVAAHEYYAAGIDRRAYPDGIQWLQRRGFVETGEAVAMGRQLYDLEWPPDVHAAEASLRADGVTIRYFDPAFTDALVAYFRAEFPSWVEFFTRKLDARHDPDEMVIATHRARVIGYCQHLDADHVGPFGVAAAYRGRGIGSVMLYRLLDRMRQKGYRFAWFGETGLARPYYERAGFHVTREYALLRREIEASR